MPSLRYAIVAGLMWPLAACGPSEPPGSAPTPVPKPAPAANPAAPIPPEPAATPPAKPGTTLPPASSKARYVGRWAAAETACGHEAMDFYPARLQSAATLACTFDSVRPVAGGYDIHARCTGDGAPADVDLTVRFAESAHAMLIDGGPFEGGAGLIYCGPTPSSKP